MHTLHQLMARLGSDLETQKSVKLAELSARATDERMLTIGTDDPTKVYAYALKFRAATENRLSDLAEEAEKRGIEPKQLSKLVIHNAGRVSASVLAIETIEARIKNEIMNAETVEQLFEINMDNCWRAEPILPEAESPSS